MLWIVAVALATEDGTPKNEVDVGLSTVALSPDDDVEGRYHSLELELGYTHHFKGGPHGIRLSYSQRGERRWPVGYWGTPRVEYVLSTRRPGWGARFSAGLDPVTPTAWALGGLVQDDELAVTALVPLVSSARARGQLRYDTARWGGGIGLAMTWPLTFEHPTQAIQPFASFGVRF
ncbi:MAG: hypothetical protein H6737_06460 [Alphaproteobacteria bacterium]|nr:hypothetical protein [Alphaproteobacteria bacterium]